MLNAETFVARSQRRRLRVTHLVLAGVIGVMSAASIALIAGAQRSSTVVDRFLDAEPHYDLMVSAPGLEKADVRSLPGVVSADPVSYVALGAQDSGDFVGVSGQANDFAVRNPAIRVLSGAWPATDDPSQIVVNSTYAAEFGVEPGDGVTIKTFALDQTDDVQRGIYELRGPTYQFTVAAVVRLPKDNVLEGIRTPRAHTVTDAASIIVSSRFWEQHHHEFLEWGAAYNVALRDGMAGAPAFREALADKLATTAGDLLWEPVSVRDRRGPLAAPVRVETTALLVIGIGAAISTVAALVVLLLLERRRLEPDTTVIRQSGFTSSQLAAVGALRIAPSALLAAAIAVAGSLFASGRFPIGIGRRLELDGGRQFTAPVALGGLVVIAATLLLTTAVSFERPSRRTSSASSRAVTTAPLPIALGIHLAAGTGRSRRRSTTLAELGTVAIAVAAGVVIAVWVTGVGRISDEPARHGFGWDVAIGNVNLGIDPERVAQLERDPRVAAATETTYGQVAIDGSQVEVLVFDPNGTAPPAVVSGRLPETATEVALGAGVMRELGVGIGDTVTLSVNGTELAGESAVGRDVALRVVGEGIAPQFGESDIANTGLLPTPALVAAGGNTSSKLVLVDVAGSDRKATIDGLVHDYTEEMYTDVVPGRVMNLDQVRDVPLAGLAVVFVLGTAILIASLAAAGRGNRRTLAVLRSLGLDSVTRRFALVWQGLIAGAVVVLIGIPLGLVAGSMLWNRTVAGLGIRPGMHIPSGTLAIGVATTVATAVATALIVGNRPRGTVLTSQLRAE